MPKQARVLSALEVKRLHHAGCHPVGGIPGLRLQVRPPTAKSWILRVVVGKRQRDIGLGGYPAVPLQEAREEARAVRQQIVKGIDPITTKRDKYAKLALAQAQRVTFDEAARVVVEQKRPEFRNGKHAAQWESTLKTYASPVLGILPVADIELAHIEQVLRPIWTSKTETAKRVRGRIETVLDWAKVSGYRQGDNPARWRGNLDKVLAKPSKIAPVSHHRSLSVDEVPEFMKRLRERHGMGARGLEFLVLTAARSGEVRGATWDEISIDGALWVIPGQRMKVGREHRVPLSQATVERLKELPRLKDCPYVFPSARGKMLSDMSLSAVLKRMNVNAVPHGFRSTFRDWCAEHTNYPHEVAEMALAHTIANKTEAAYRRGDLLDKRRALMEDWAAYCLQAISCSG